MIPYDSHLLEFVCEDFPTILSQLAGPVSNLGLLVGAAAHRVWTASLEVEQLLHMYDLGPPLLLDPCSSLRPYAHRHQHQMTMFAHSFVAGRLTPRNWD